MNVEWKAYILTLLSTYATWLSPDAYAQCTTVVPGSIISGQTWVPAGSPYCVDGDVLVNSLIIQPGVRIEFTGPYEFEIAGILKANGTQESPIVFTAESNNLTGWRGIFFNWSLPGSELVNVIVEGSNDTGIEIQDSSPTLRDCVIRNNVRATNGTGGGGIYTNAPLTVTACTIEDNGVVVTGSAAFGTASAYGGGIYSESDLNLIDTRITHNTASAHTPATYSHAIAHGGGLYVAGLLLINRSTIDSNIVSSGAHLSSNSQGGGIYALGSSTITNAFVTRNSALGSAVGGGIYLGGGGEVINSTVAENIAQGLYTTGAALDVVNSIFWGNSIAQIAGAADVTFSDIQGGIVGTGNLNLNPLFVNPDPSALGFDVHLDPFSPLIDMGTDAYSGLPADDIDSQARPEGAGYDIGADEYVSDTDGDGIPDGIDNCTLAANPDQRDTDSDGYGNRCDGDFNNDLLTNAFDVSILKADYGKTGDLESDLNSDNKVNAFDVSILKALYGKPPGPSALVP